METGHTALKGKHKVTYPMETDFELKSKHRATYPKEQLVTAL